MDYPLACFEVIHKVRKNGREVSVWAQQQDMAPTINQRVVTQLMKERALPAPVTRPELTAYASLVTWGAITWKQHVDIVSVREGWDVRTGGGCYLCGQTNTRQHVLGTYPL